MTETNINELKELADLREWVKGLEKAVEETCWTYDNSSGYHYCEHCRVWDITAGGSNNYDHKPDCIVTKIRQRRGE